MANGQPPELPPGMGDPDAPQPIGGMPKSVVPQPGGLVPGTVGTLLPLQPRMQRDKLVPAQYFEGEEWTPMRLDAPQIMELQRLLVEAGLMSPNAVTGFWDITSATAYKEVMMYANQLGVAVDEALAMLVAHPVGKGGPGGGMGAQTVTATGDLVADIKAFSAQKLNRQVSDEDAAAFAAWYQDRQAGAQTSQQAAAMAGGGRTQAVMSEEVAADQWLRERYGREADEADVGRAVEYFNTLMGQARYA